MINISKIKNRRLYRLRRSNSYELLFVKKGAGRQLIDFNSYTIKNHSAYIIKPRQIHQCNGQNLDYGLCLDFTEDALLPDVIAQSLSIINMASYKAILFEEDKMLYDEFTARLITIYKLQKKDVKFRKIRLMHHLSNLLYFIEELISTSQNYVFDKNEELILKFTHLVRENFTNLSITEYADALKISSRKLAMLSNKHLGLSPLKYIHHFMLLEIKREMIYSKLSHKELAYKYGFDAPSNFSNFVKSKTGVSPSLLQNYLHNLILKKKRVLN